VYFQRNYCILCARAQIRHFLRGRQIRAKRTFVGANGAFCSNLLNLPDSADKMKKREPSGGNAWENTGKNLDPKHV
jgi:hypothetical protein